MRGRVRVIFLRIVLHPVIKSAQYFQRIACLETSRALKELLSQLMPSGLYLFIAFLRTNS